MSYEISKGTLEIPHSICYPYIERHYCYSVPKMEELSALRARERFQNDPQVMVCTTRYKLLPEPVFTKLCDAIWCHFQNN